MKISFTNHRCICLGIVFLFFLYAIFTCDFLSVSAIILFFICSFLLLLLYYLVFNVLKISTIFNFDAFPYEKHAFSLITIASIIIAAAYYSYIVLSSNTIKVWDNSCYYRLSLAFESFFEYDFRAGVKHFIDTIYYDDYNQFLLLFTYPIFRLTNQTHNSFIFSYFIAFIIPCIIIWNNIAKKTMVKLSCNNHLVYATLAFFIATFPSLHISSSKGMPDIIGLIFIGCIILLTWDYDFKILDPKHMLLLGGFSIFLFLSRRWYSFWLLAYYLCYFSQMLFLAYKSENHQTKFTVLKNITIYSMIMSCILIFFFYPLIERILNAGYSTIYNAYDLGGLKYEFISQCKRLGFINICLLIIGVVIGILTPNIRRITIRLTLVMVLTLIFFTHIHNMSNHHTLLLVPSYIFIISISMISLAKWSHIGGIIICGIFLFTSFYNSLLSPKLSIFPMLYGNVSIAPEVRKDMDFINEISNFIQVNCDSQNKIYINLGSEQYNPETFANGLLPSINLYDCISKESSVDLTHGFSTDFFKSKYALLADPIQEAIYGQEQKVIPIINDAIMGNSPISNKWQLKKSYIINDINFYIYERKLPVDMIEQNFFVDKFTLWYPEYPSLFKDRILEYVP